MNKIKKECYFDPEEIEAVNALELPGTGTSFSAKVRYCVREQLQREAVRDA